MIQKLIDAIAFRTTKQYNKIKIRSLEPNYWDKDTLLLHGMMQLVVDFVEVECASCYGFYYKESMSLQEKLIYMLPWYLRNDNWFRSRKRGELYLKYQASLNDPNLDEHERTPWQAKSAQEVLDVYLWWKDIRPNRMDLDDATISIEDFIKIERQYYEEDGMMLKRIVDVRGYLWT